MFMWVARTGTALPNGLEVGTASRGLEFYGWAPQVEVLRHYAMGWNLMLKVATARVAMLAWPMGADQFMDARQHGGHGPMQKFPSRSDRGEGKNKIREEEKKMRK